VRAGTWDGLKSPAKVAVPVFRRTYRGARVPITTAHQVHTGDSTRVREDTHRNPNVAAVSSDVTGIYPTKRGGSGSGGSIRYPLDDVARFYRY